MDAPEWQAQASVSEGTLAGQHASDVQGLVHGLPDVIADLLAFQFVPTLD